ncbi:MAG: hypothetical protein AAGM84_05770 [Pseudomonadota bacterium]
MSLEARLLAAHAAQDADALIGVYTDAADAAPDVDTACFFLTHAYVFALEAGDMRAEDLRLRLAREGREPTV